VLLFFLIVIARGSGTGDEVRGVWCDEEDGLGDGGISYSTSIDGILVTMKM